MCATKTGNADQPEEVGSALSATKTNYTKVVCFEGLYINLCIYNSLNYHFVKNEVVDTKPYLISFTHNSSSDYKQSTLP